MNLKPWSLSHLNKRSWLVTSFFTFETSLKSCLSSVSFAQSIWRSSQRNQLPFYIKLNTQFKFQLHIFNGYGNLEEESCATSLLSIRYRRNISSRKDFRQKYLYWFYWSLYFLKSELHHLPRLNFYPFSFSVFRSED